MRAAGRAQARKEQLHAANHAGQIDVHGALPLLERNVLEAAGRQNADVVHEQMDLAEALQRGRAQPFEVRFAGDVALEAERVRTGLADRVRRVQGTRFVEIGHDDAYAAAGQGKGSRSAAAAAAPHHHREGAIESKGRHRQALP